MNWRKIAGWALATALMLVLLVVTGGYFFVKSKSFNRFASRKIAESVQQITGAQTSIRNLDFSFSHLTANLYGIILRGKESADQPPLLTIDQLTVGIKIESLLHRKFHLNELIVTHPVANVRVDPSGASNLPTPSSNSSKSHTSVFELAVRHARLIDGAVTYDDKKTPLQADLYDLNTEIEFASGASQYSGTISYDKGKLQYGNYTPLPHALAAKFDATPAGASIESAILKIGNSVVSLRAKMENYNDPALNGEYDLHLDTSDFASMLPQYKPSGSITLSGQIHYRNNPNQTALRSLSLEGVVDSSALAATANHRRVFVSNVRGKYQLANGAFEAPRIELDALGGNVTTNVSVQKLDASPSGQVRASLRGISLAAMQRLLGAQVKQAHISGTISGTAEAVWRNSLSNLLVRSDLTVGAEASSASGSTTASNDQVPVDGVIHATYDLARGEVALRQSTLRIPSATVTADGQISDHSNLRLQVNAGNVQQLESLASAFGVADSLPTVSGTAKLVATVRGTLARPQIAAQLSAQNLAVRGTNWRTLQASVQANPSRLAISNGVLVSAQSGKASFGATVALRNWHYDPNNSFAGNLSVQSMPIADLQRAAKLDYSISGDLSANVSISGTQLKPQGSGTLQITNASAYDQPVQALAAQFHTDQDTIVASIHLGIPAGSTDANIAYTPKTNGYRVSLNAPSLVLQKLQIVQAKNLGLKGTLSASVSGQGTIENPQLRAVLKLPQLSIRGKSVSEIEAQLQIANQKADLQLNSNVAEAAVRAQAKVNLTGAYYTEASIQTTSIPLDVLLAAYLSSVPEGFKGQTELHATLNGPLKDKTQIEAHLTIPTLSATYQSLQIGIASPVRADFAHSILTVQPAEIKGTDSDFRVQGSIPFAGNSAPSLTAQGSIDMRIVKIFSPEAQSSGTVAFDVHGSGSAQNPNVNGQVRLQNVAMLYPGAPLGIDRLNGTFDLGDNSVQISKLTGRVGGGDVSAGGSIVYRPALNFNIAMQGKSIRLLYPAGVRTLLDSNLVFSGNKDSSTLSGRVLIDSLGFTRDFDLSNFGDQFSGETSLPAQPGFADSVNLAVSVQSKDNLNANSSQISIEGSLNLRVIGTAANPVITGRTDLTSGELFYRNVRYELQRGIITFDNPTETSPVLNVSATTTVEQYNLTLNLRGPIDKLTTSYTSDPPLATADIINLVARGQTTAESAAASTSTDSIIASQATSEVTGRLQKLTGISSLQIDPLMGGAGQNPSAEIALQQRVTKNLLFSFSTDVSQPGSEIVQGDYRINKRWSMSVTRDQVGGVSVDGRLHTHF